MRFKTFFINICGFAFIILIWQIYAVQANPLIIANPYDTFKSIHEIFASTSSLHDFYISLKRMLSGVIASFFLGLVLGLLSGFVKSVEIFLEPIRWVCMSISPVIVVILAMLWFGLGDKMVLFLTIIILSPIIYINVVKGIRFIDKNLLEMAKAYRLNTMLKIQEIYLPAIISPLSVATLIILSSCARVVILAEVLGANNGIGQAISNARSNLEIAKLFGWVVISLLVVAFFEYAILKPLERYLTRWNKT